MDQILEIGKEIVGFFATVSSFFVTTAIIVDFNDTLYLKRVSVLLLNFFVE